MDERRDLLKGCALLVFCLLCFQCSCPHEDFLHPIPDHHKREAQEESEDSSKLGHQRGPGVDQLLCLREHVVGNCPQGEEEGVASLHVRGCRASYEAVAVVVTGLEAAHSYTTYVLFIVQCTEENIKFPESLR